jgi:hypothetical protein
MFSRLPPVHGDDADEVGQSAGGPDLIHEAGPAQPCPAHRYACTIYRDRPGACQHYECALLRRHLAGAVSEEEALFLVARAKGLRDRARAGIESVVGAHAGLGLNDLAAQFAALIHHEGPPRPSHSGKEEAEAQARLGALDEILAGHFHLDHEGTAEPAPA